MRKKHAVTQEFLANRIGVSRPTYAQIENGSRRMYADEARTLAAFFGLSLEDFLEGRDTPAPKVTVGRATRKKKRTGMRISVPQERMDKCRELILYILQQVGSRPNIGEAVLCKMLYFIDFDYYEKFEEQLIGAKYIKNRFGPTPVEFPKLIEKMKKDGDIQHVVRKYFQHHQRKYIPCRSPDLSGFSAREKEHIDWEIERFKDYSAVKMEQYSHKDIPWITADDQRQIPYESVFYRTPEFSVRQYDDDTV